MGTDLLYRWKRGTQVWSGGTRAVGEHSGADDLRALQRKNAQLRMDNGIFKKSTPDVISGGIFMGDVIAERSETDCTQ